jgi:putative flippase GtrA
MGTAIRNLFLSRQFILFVAAGCVAALANFLSRIFFSSCNIPFYLAVVLAYLLGMFIAFLLFNYVVFKRNTNSMGKSVIGFTIVNIIGILITLAVSSFMYYCLLPAVNYNYCSAELSHFTGISFTTFTSFIGHKFFSFRESV